MTSQINTSNIDILYPIAGQDNNSQGFRDNFAAIQTGLATASSEITTLQSHAIVSADSNNAAVINNFGGSTLSNGYYNRFYGIAYSAGSITTSADIDLHNGPIQQYTLTQNATLTFRNWPASGCGIVRVHVKSNLGGVFVPTFATENSGTIKYDVNYPSSPVGIINVFGSSATTNVVIVSNTASLSINMPIIFNQSIGNIVAGAVYYVKDIVNGSQFTLKTAANGTNAVVLTNTTSNGGITVSQANVLTPGFTVGGESLLSATVTHNGSNYTTPASITVTGGSPLVQYVVPSLNATYQIVSATPSGGSAGTGFAVGDVLVLNSNSLVTFTVSSITGGGATGPINSVSVLTAGGPLPAPLSGVKGVTAVTGSGTGARLTIISGIFGINVTNPGDGYNTVVPTITITGSTSSDDATAVVTLTLNTADNVKVIEAWSFDAGATVYVKYLGEY